MYCLIVIDDYSRFTWIFFLATKDETDGILKLFITGIENLVDHKNTNFKFYETIWVSCYHSQYHRSLRKFDGKAGEVFFVGYSLNSKSFKVFNSRTKIMEENLHIRFSKSIPNVVGTQSNGFTENECNDQEKEDNVNRTKNVNTVNNAGTNRDNVVGENISIELQFNPNMPALEDVSRFDFSSDDEDDGVVADMNNLDTTIQVSLIPTMRIHKDHPFDQVIRDLQSAAQTRKMLKNLEEHGFVSTIQQRTNHKDLQNCLFGCFLSQEEPKKVIHALKDPRLIEAMQEEILQFKLQEAWTLVDLPNRKRAIGSKWVFRNKKDERGIMIRNKARLVSQGLFLAYALFKDFMVYQMDVKSVFLYEKIEEEVYVCQPTGFEDLDFLDRVYKVEKASYGLHQAPRAWHKGDILLVKVYVDDIFFGSTKKELCIAFERFTKVKTASTPMETQKPLLKDEDDEEQVNLKDSPFDLVAYTDSDYARESLDRKSTTEGCQFLGCRLISWQCKKQTVVANSTTEAKYVAASTYTDSDYARESLDRKSTTEGYQFLGCRLISWQCKKQTVVANSTTEAKYVAASSYCG
nr:hypothetical protein [Tanacetum cinerariifolium]